MASGDSRGQEDQSRLLARELRSKQNARFLHRMPPFKLDEELPDSMQSLLDRLEQSERRGGGGHQTGVSGAIHAPEL